MKMNIAMHVSEVADEGNYEGQKSAERIELVPHHFNPEDKNYRAWAKEYPTGRLEIWITEPSFFDKINLGDKFMITMEKA